MNIITHIIISTKNNCFEKKFSQIYVEKEVSKIKFIGHFWAVLDIEILGNRQRTRS